MPEQLPPQVENEIFTENLRIISSTLRDNGVLGFCVGGLPITATLGKTVTARRPGNGTVTDFDYLGLGPDEKTILKTTEQLRRIGKTRPVFPDIGIEPASFQSTPVPPAPFKLLSGVRIDPRSRKIFLFYQGIEVEVPSETMRPQSGEINGVPFTIPPLKTLWWRAIERGGMLKLKDDTKLFGLADYIRKNCPDNPPDELYSSHLDFILKVNQQYPFYVNLYQMYWEIDRRLNGRISGASALYGLIALFRK